MNSADRQAPPKARPLRGAALWRALLATLAGGTLWCAGIDLKEGSAVTLRNFRTQGRGENGARWFLEGQKAVIRGRVFDLAAATVRIETDDGRTALVTAEHCTYYQDSGLLESDAAVRVESGDAVLAGVGFDMLMPERRLRIRDAVRMEIPQKNMSLGVPPGNAPAREAVPPSTPAPGP
jgi:hypothetical protein